MNKTIDSEKLIIKKDKFGLIAFYPDVSATYGNIMSMTFNEGHSEASIQYYWKTKKPTEKEVLEFIATYENHYNCKVIRRHKLTYKEQLKIWGRV